MFQCSYMVKSVFKTNSGSLQKKRPLLLISLSIYHPHKAPPTVSSQVNLQNGFLGPSIHSSALSILNFTPPPSSCHSFHSNSSPLKGVSTLFQQPPGHCIPYSNSNKYVGVWWVFFLTGRPRTSECGFWFQVFPTFWPTLLSPTTLGSPTFLQPHSLPNLDSGWETEGYMLPSLDVTLFGFHE